MSQQDNSLHFVAIDMGSNSFHLVIAREQDGTIQTLHKEKRQVQLADGIAANGILDSQAMERGLTCLTEFHQRFSGLEQTRVRLVATHALRVAKNARQFIKAASKIIPYPIEIVSGHEEARLIYSGICNSQSLQARNLVIDIGGGSTEVVIGKQTKATTLASLKCGCVSYNKRFFTSGVLDKASFKAAQAAADKQFSLLPNVYFKGDWPLVLGSSGSVKAIYEAINDQLDPPVDISLERLIKLKRDLLAVGHIDNINLPDLDPKRIPLLAAGLCILISFFKRLAIDSMQVAQGALREGITYELAHIGQQKSIKQRTVTSLARLYHADPVQAENVSRSVGHLFEQVRASWPIASYLWLLDSAAELHEIGIHINSRSHHKHGGYIIENSDLPGFSQQQQNLLALLVLNHRKRINQYRIEQLEPEEKLLVTRLLVIFRLAIVLNLGRINTETVQVQIEAYDSHVYLRLPSTLDEESRLLRRDLATEQSKIAKLGIKLIF
ncbi:MULTISPECIES: Ppx/GppA phosphatase family protein [unclassified Shewanella]|uniref:Ppx/GppA phosphatase family protein n=1 Tax=unclassified Shewanella TaxID=196818 RepID=UPI001BC42247|nr:MULTISPECIES: Ppx/GppA phosphatase family protein [unclassified Shewanella]GIU04991.1 exopolyphosphatase [Shewanella sp. MBTL60-112-B1]GIU24545.1 exopolyphosphatase [Shewanella sp. MBTL60-112-B2]